MEATRILAEQTDSRVLRKQLTLVVEDLRAGQSLSSALAKHPKVFPPIFVSMIQTGEVSGNMDTPWSAWQSTLKNSIIPDKK